jgi:Mn2+/Fe2+ NRAMP family transporter
MAKTVSFKQGLMSVLFWSIISAAFIGPGTVTTASKAGAGFQLDLLWALCFSILATIILQEAAARITIASGKNLGEIIAIKFGGKENQRIKLFLFFAVLIGCAAYQAGNILGAVSGLSLVGGFSQSVLILLIGLVCFGLLWIGNFRIIANMLGLVVALMGIAFLYIAFQTDWNLVNVAGAALKPGIPDGSLLLIIGLIGTTIVPYNLFLASGISQGQSIAEMRWGIMLAVIIGGIVSIAIMVVGTQVEGEFSFAALAEAMSIGLGKSSALFFGFGLFAAGLSSSITSPLAAAVTAKSLFAGANNGVWENNSTYFRLVWAGVLGVGLLFGLLQVKPIPAIILAQAVNGVLLPIIVIFLILSVNDEKLLGKKYTNSIFSNILTLAILAVTSFLGLNNLWKAILNIFPALSFSQKTSFSAIAVLAVLITLWVGMKIFQKK